MQSIGLTGGIASGKSSAMDMLRSMTHLRIEFFDADESVSRQLKHPERVREIEQCFGLRPGEDGGLDRSGLRDIVFSNSSKRRDLEAILHPHVREDCLAKLAGTRQAGGVARFIADIPLLFESDFDDLFDVTWLVACSRSTQVRRLQERSGLDLDLIERILDAQWPMERKLREADHVLWNEGPRDLLRHQLERLLPPISQ